MKKYLSVWSKYLNMSAGSLLLAASACSSPSEGTAQNEAAVVSSPMAAGKFLLHKESNHTADPKCDTYTTLEVANGNAALQNELTGGCSLVAMYDPQPRGYSLRLTATSCGSKVYEGATRVPIGPAATGLATIKITDHRTRVCEDLVPAQIIVEESHPAAVAPKMYSQAETAPSCAGTCELTAPACTSGAQPVSGTCTGPNEMCCGNPAADAGVALCGGQKNPAGCSDSNPCPAGKACVPNATDKCISSGCSCDTVTNAWSCLPDCSGNVCQ